MPHETSLISTIVVGLVLAFILGAVANRLRFPPLVGYLIAGVAVGPFTPGFVADSELANQLSEIGVILLMFGVGLHFSLKDLLSVRSVAIPGAIVQIAGATLMGLLLALGLGWSLGGGLIFGLALSVASTVVLLKALQDRRMIDSDRGRIAVGWLIVEDLAMVLALVLIPALAELWSGDTGAIIHDPILDVIERGLGVELGLAGALAVTVLKLAAFVTFMLLVGRRVIPYVLHETAHTGSRELFRLAVLSIALGVAAGASYVFGVSLALGAFFAGMVLAESQLSHRAAEESLPLRDAFAVLFFVSVGMLFDPMIIVTQPLPLLATLAIILFGKSIFAFLIVIAFRRPVATALTISASLAQIGEFSFILATLGVGIGLLPPEGRSLILAGAILSIVANPVMFWLVDQVKPLLEARYGPPDVEGGRLEPPLAGEPGASAPVFLPDKEGEYATALTSHIVLIGYGSVGSVIAQGLKAANRPFVVIEAADDRIAAARAAGIEVVGGNAATGRPLKLANIEGASAVIVAIPNAFEAGQAVVQCRRANPEVRIVARAHSDEEQAYLADLGANTVIMGAREIGMAMLDLVNPSKIAAMAGLGALEAALAPAAVAGVAGANRAPAAPAAIDEEALARAIGAPSPAPAAAARPALATTRPEPGTVTPAPPEPPARTAPAGPPRRRPARTPATPFELKVRAAEWPHDAGPAPTGD